MRNMETRKRVGNADPAWRREEAVRPVERRPGRRCSGSDRAIDRLRLPQVWAVAEAARVAAPAPAVEVAFYRKYTEALLRRYVKMSMESGRVPSFLGRELFRGNVTHYKVRGFDDVVIFCADVEKCLQCLNAVELELVRRVAMQEYTQGEVAVLMRRSLRGVVRGYAAALDVLSARFLELRILEALPACQ